ncbi:MAG: FeoA family protein [Opitutaceae bacterium]
MNQKRDPFRPQRMRLTELPNGAAGRVCQLAGQAEVCQRLREMGVGESIIIERVSGQRTLLCQVSNTRIALSEGAAQHIFVELVRSARP